MLNAAKPARMADGTRVGVLLLQLGTPAAPTPAALRPYLREFLSDRRVIDLPRAVWLPILMGIVLRTRPRASALLYQKIWTPEGSPLAVTTDKQARLLDARLRAAGLDVRVLPAMRYGEPSIASALSSFAADGIDRLLAFPMYPQYAGATTGSSLEKLFALTQTARVVPSIRVVPPYYADAHYIDALATVTRESVAALADPPEQCLLSFHELDPDLPLYHLTSMSERVKGSLARQRFLMLLLSVFAGVAMVLAAIGIYSVMAYLVSQGTREIGIRIALGATPRGILGLMLRQGATVVAAGLGAGLLGAAALAGLVRSLLFEVRGTDPITFLAVAGSLGAVALLATYIPAQRAARIDPIHSLRND